MSLQSNLDEKDQATVDFYAYAAKDAADAGNWQLSTDLWAITELVIWDLTNYVDFYNVLKYVTFEKEAVAVKKEHFDTEAEYYRHKARVLKPQISKLN